MKRLRQIKKQPKAWRRTTARCPLKMKAPLRQQIPVSLNAGDISYYSLKTRRDSITFSRWFQSHTRVTTITDIHELIMSYWRSIARALLLAPLALAVYTPVTIGRIANKVKRLCSMLCERLPEE